MSDLSSIFRLREVHEKQEAYKKYIDKILKEKNVKALIDTLDHLVNKEGSEQNGRTYTTPEVLMHMIKEVGRVPEDEKEEELFLDIEDQTAVAEAAVKFIKEKKDDFPTQLMHATRLLSECYQAEGDFKKAAFTLNSFRFDGYRTPVEATPEEKLQWYVDTTQFFLEVDESGLASQSIARARGFVSGLPKDSELHILFKSSYARVQDSQRSFLNAAREYARLSQCYGMIAEDVLLETLKYAVTCAVLAPPGPERTRLLATLYADERAAQLPNYQMLTKVFNDRFIRNVEVEKFKKLLAPHQNAITPGGGTVLGTAVMEHNVLAASRIYNNVSFSELGDILGISALKAEDLARKMIENGQVEGTIDQVEGLVIFANRAGALLGWDKQISSVCLEVNHVLDKINKAHPSPSYRV